MTSRLKEGYYLATIESWSLGEAKTGTPQFIITFILDGYKGAGGRKEECPNLKRSTFRAITENTIEYFVNDLKALGYDRDDFDGLDPKSSVAHDFGGIEIEVKMKYETGPDNKEREKWELAVVGGKPNVKELEQDAISVLNAKFGGNLKALKGNTPPAPRKPAPAASSGYPGNAKPAPAAAPAGGGDDEETPF